MIKTTQIKFSLQSQIPATAVTYDRYQAQWEYQGQEPKFFYGAGCKAPLFTIELYIFN